MSKIDVSGHAEQGRASVDSEIALLISEIVTPVQPETHPCQSMLDVLNTDVEDDVRTVARHEINFLAHEVSRARQEAAAQVKDAEPVRKKSVNPFAPIAPPPPAPVWLEEAILAQETIDAGTNWARPGTELEIARDQAYEEDVIDAAPFVQDPVPAPVLMSPMLDDGLPYADDYVDIYEPETSVAAHVSAGGGGNWFGHSPDGLPLWASAGIPVAAVSIFALGFLAFGTKADPQNIDAVAVAPATLASAVNPSATDLLASASAPSDIAAQPTDALATPAPVPAHLPEPAPVPAIASAQTSPPGQTVAASLPADRSAAIVSAGSVILPIVEAAKPEHTIASAPSLKPAGLAPKAATFTPAPTPKAAFSASPLKPRRTLPVRMFSGRIEPGSAAHITNAVAQQSGPRLSQTEKLWLARDVERALEREIDGRSVSLKSRQGQRVRLSLKASSQIQREFTFMRASEIGSLPHNMVIEGGWYAARHDTLLHAMPALNTGLRHRTLKRDQLIERMAIFTDRYADRWYLMGQRGVAVGFVSAADVVLAGAHTRPLGDPYAASQGPQINELRTVYTTCRKGFIGPEGGLVQKFDFCRDARGHWVSHGPENISTRQASLAGPLLPKTGTASAIVLAEATGDPITFHAFGNRKFRRRMQADLVHARFGQTTEQVMANGDLIKLTFGETYQSESVAPVLRVEGVGKVATHLRVDARWMKAPIGTKLHATPDILSQAMMEDIPAGAAVEVLGRVPGLRGQQDWMLVGRSGVGFGYVPAHQLTQIEGRVSPMAVKNQRPKAVADLVKVINVCRSVEYETVRNTGTFDACQQADGNWALKAEPKISRQFAATRTVPKTAP